MTDYGIEEYTAEDEIYQGSTFREVVDALYENPYQRVWGGENEPPLPIYEVTLQSLLIRILSRAHGLFRTATARAVDSHADLRWGPNRKGFHRLLHPNGICLVGEWRITSPTDYSGYFATGSAALAVGRYSTCCTETRRAARAGHSPSSVNCSRPWIVNIKRRFARRVSLRRRILAEPIRSSSTTRNCAVHLTQRYPAGVSARRFFFSPGSSLASSTSSLRFVSCIRSPN